MLNLTKALELTIKSRSDAKAYLELEQMIKDKIALQQAKDSGNANIFKALKKLIDNIIKDEQYRPMMHGVWIDNITEKQYFCNGKYIIEINKPVEGLKQLDKGVTALDPKNILPKDNSDYPHIFNLDIVSIKTHLKEVEATGRANCGSKGVKDYVRRNALTQIGLGWYPSTLIMEIVSVLGTDILVYHAEGEKKPCLIVSETGRALIMPVIKHKYE